ncbi:MAG: PD40 domain-containing protein, partial [Alphaproteobacteria bacterium]|nr:PD40 domain-containing protein [Alphaproteobacteria bacterium]
MTEIASYGAWRSPITSELIVAESLGIADIRADGGDIYWIEGRPSDAGRNVVVRRGPAGTVDDVTPPPYSVRTRVHEYGGGAMNVHRGFVYFTNFADQRLYQQAGGMEPMPLTPPPDPQQGGLRWRYADGILDEPRRRWVGVREEHTESRVDNTLVAVELAKPGPGTVLAQGADFYASPALSPDGKRLAWLSWNHPNMPWVGTELWLADIASDGSLAAPRRIAGSDNESIFQPQWSPDGVLYFVSDRSGWWNLYRCEPKGGGAVHALCPREAEFGRAQWNFAQSTYAFLSAEQLVCAYTEDGRDRLARVDIRTGRLTPLDLPYTDFGHIRAVGDKIVCRAGSPADPPAIVLIDPANGACEVLRSSAPALADGALRAYVSAPQHLAFPTERELAAHAKFYPPHNPNYAAPASEKPPLVVKCHGGP